MERVLIATPTYDGKLDVWYVNSLLQTVALGKSRDIEFVPIFMAYDALIQRARNDLMKVAVDGNFDSMIWIDSDMEWDPAWAIELAKSDYPVIGGTCRKKTDDQEIYVASFSYPYSTTEEGYICVNSLGTGFTKLSSLAIDVVYESSTPYKNPGGKDGRMVFDVQIVDGELYGEDSILFKKLRDLCFNIFLAPHMTCNHIGTKKYVGDFQQYLKKLG